MTWQKFWVAFPLVAGSVFGIVAHVRTDDVHLALLWFIWGGVLASLNLLVDIYDEIRKRPR